MTHGRVIDDMGGKSRKTDSLSPSPTPSPVPSPIPTGAAGQENMAFNIPGSSPAAAALASSLANYAAMHGKLDSCPSSQSSKMCKESIEDSTARQPPQLASLHSSETAGQMTQDHSLNHSRKLTSADLVLQTPSQAMFSTNESRRTIWKCKRCIFK